MGWEISLICPCCKRPIFVSEHQEGSIIDLDGSTEADISVTYNYSKYFDFSVLNGRKAKSTIKLLEQNIEKLGTIQDSNYWIATEGNVGHILNLLLQWAKKHPQAIWEVGG